MKKSIKTTIVSLAMCSLLIGSAAPVFAASVPVNVTGNVSDGFIDSTPFKELTGSASEIRLMDGQSMDFYVSSGGTSGNAKPYESRRDTVGRNGMEYGQDGN